MGEEKLSINDFLDTYQTLPKRPSKFVFDNSGVVVTSTRSSVFVASLRALLGADKATLEDNVYLKYPTLAEQFQIPISDVFAVSRSAPKLTLYPHQIDAVKWMIQQETKGIKYGSTLVTGGVLGDSMGLGKTKSFVTMLTIQGPSRTLIVLPKSVIFQWVRELHMQGHRVFYIEPNDAYPAKIDSSGRAYFEKASVPHRRLPESFVGISSWGMIRPFPEPSKGEEVKTSYLDDPPEDFIPFRHIVWDRIAIDEAHTLRNGFKMTGEKSFGTAKVLKYYRAHRLRTKPNAPRWGLSGTPLQNRLSDLASLFLWIGMPVDKTTTTDDIAHYVETKLFRRSGANLHALTKEAIHFPDTHFEDNRVEIEYKTGKETAFYTAASTDIADRLDTLELLKDSGYSGVTTEDNMLLILNMLRFLSAHPQVYIEAYNKRYEEKISDWVGPCSKIDMIQEKLSELYDADESCIIFIHFDIESKMLFKAARNAGYKYVDIMNGTVTPEDRDWIAQKGKQLIEAGEKIVIIASITSCGEGLNLQFLHNVIIATPDWNPSNELQAIGRVHRIGQTELVRVWRYYHTILDKVTINIDNYMRNLQTKKERIVDDFVTEARNAAWDFPATDLPGQPGTPSVSFAPLAGVGFGAPPATPPALPFPVAASNPISAPLPSLAAQRAARKADKRK
jgi:SNF2 family DNA or RNA helicase